MSTTRRQTLARRVLCTAAFIVCIFAQIFVNSERVVVFQPVLPYPNSHFFLMNRLTSELSSRGHHLMVVVPEDIAKHVPRGANITLHNFAADPGDEEESGRMLKKGIFWDNTFSEHVLISILQQKVSRCECFDGNQNVLPALKEFAPDVVVHDFMFPCAFVAAAKLKVPLVSVQNSFISSTWFNSWNRGSPWRLQIPNPLAYNPQPGLNAYHPFTLPQRIHNSLLYFGGQLLQAFGVDPSLMDLMKRNGVELNDANSYGRSAMLLANAHFGVQQAAPLPPHVQMVGPIMLQPAKPLPPDLEEFVNTSEEGVVVASAGTVLALEHEQLVQMGRALSRLPTHVVWKLSKRDIPNQAALDALQLADNVKVVDWMPQNDLLAHNKTRAFVNHCGINSVYEALWHGVPIVCLPGFGDQPDNAARVASQGAGLALPFIWKVREKQLHEALTRLLTEPSFRHAAGAVGKRLRAQKRTGAQQSVDWIEHVMETEGAAYLRPPVDDLPFVVRHSLDVIAFWWVCAAALLGVTWRQLPAVARQLRRLPAAARVKTL